MMLSLAGLGGLMSDESGESFEQIGIIQLIKNMLSPRTLPHIIMIALISTILLFLVESQEVLVAMSFISLAVSYVLVAMLSNSKIVQNLTKLPEQKGESQWLVRLFFSFRITIVPILIAAIIVGILWSFTGGYDNGWISPLLASLFIVWSIAQAASFRAGMVEWLANGLGDAKLHTYQEKISTASQIFVVQIFALVILWLGQIISQTEKMTLQDALIGGIAFIVVSVLLQVVTLWLTREERESWITDHNASVTKEMKTGAEDENVANSMVDHLLSAGSLTFGGTMSGDRAGVGAKKGRSSKKKGMRRIDMTASRGRK